MRRPPARSFRRALRGGSGIRAARAAAPALGILLAGAGGAGAQLTTHETIDRTPPWTEDVAVLGVNALVGGVVAGVGALLRGGDAGDAFLDGALGGAVVFAGKRVAIQGFDGAGLLGRMTGGVGSSMVAGAAESRPLLSEVWLPVGPLWLRARGSGGVPVRVSLRELGTLVWAGTRDELAFDVSESLSNGTPVFRAERHHLEHGSRVGGIALGGVVLVGRSDIPPERVRRHEMIHVLQHDFGQRALAHPAEAWLGRRLLGRELPVVVGAVDLLLLGFYSVVGDAVEAEAYWWDAR